MKSAVVIVCDGLSSRYLGPYGNAGLPTPTIDRLAAESHLFEFSLVDDPRLKQVYGSYFSGRHALAVDRPATLPDRLRQKLVPSIMVTDDSLIAGLAAQIGFDDVIHIPARPVSQAVDDIADSGFAELFASTMDWLETASGPFLLWVHSRGMTAPWDAPYDLRCQLADEEDPDPPTDVTPPHLVQDGSIDADLMLGWRQAYSAQVIIWDMCLKPFLEELAGRKDATDTAIGLTSSRAFPLGEHGCIGISEMPLFGELLHVPWIWRFPRGSGDLALQGGLRHGQLVQPMDLFHTLLDWFEVSPPPPACWQRGYRGSSILPACSDVRVDWRDRTVARAPGQRAIRTGSWHLRQDLTLDQQQLFAKPDDVWELNDVADRCPLEVGQLSELCEQFEIALSQDEDLLLFPGDLEQTQS